MLLVSRLMLEVPSKWLIRCDSVFLAFEVVIIYLYLVETRYTPIEEIAKYFDGDDGHLDIAAVANEQVKKNHMADEKDATVQQVELLEKV